MFDIKGKRFYLIAVIAFLLFAIIPKNGYAETTANEKNSNYKWVMVSENYEKQLNGTSSDCDFGIFSTSEKVGFYCNYYQKYSWSHANLAKLYCEWIGKPNPMTSIEDGSTITFQLYLHADVTKIDKGLLMSCSVFFAEPGLGIAGTDNLQNPVYFKTEENESAFSIGNMVGMGEQTLLVSGTMPSGYHAGDKVSIYFKTTAGVYEWVYQLVERKEAPPTPTPTPKPTPTLTPTQAPTSAPTTYTIDNLIYSVESSSATVIGPVSKTATSLTIPTSIKVAGKTCKVSAINKAAFKGMAKLKSVTIGKNVKSIGKQAFYGCSKLKTITVKTKKLSSVGSNAFKGIDKKAKVVCPSGYKAKYKKLLLAKGMKATVTFK